LPEKRPSPILKKQKKLKEERKLSSSSSTINKLVLISKLMKSLWMSLFSKRLKDNTR